MVEAESKTANHQRLKEMMCHLTPKDAVIPYNICFDSRGDFWVAAKGGLFKLSGDGKQILFERKNLFPKKIAPFTQVLYHKEKIIYVVTDDKADLTEFRILDLDGQIEHEQFIDGKIQGLAVAENGYIFLTKQPAIGCDESFIYKSSMDCPLGWDELSSSFDYSFQSICSFDGDTLAVATVSFPINMYSKQSIKWINANTGGVLQSFSSVGKEDGQIYFPRCIQKYKDDMLVMDRTGRFQRFSRDGRLVEIAARIDAYIGNGFTLNNADPNGRDDEGQPLIDEAIVVCSGFVVTKNNETICDDWIEAVKLNGSSWVDGLE